jgi:hypothetical protein
VMFLGRDAQVRLPAGAPRAEIESEHKQV